MGKGVMLFPFLQIKGDIMTNILTDISTYDTNKHTVYPTLEYVKEETGIDLSQSTETEEEALRRVKFITDQAKAIFMSTKLIKTADDFEYLFATNVEYRRAWLRYVIACIGGVLMGGADELFKSTKDDVITKLSAVAQAHLNSGVLASQLFTHLYYELHVGY